MKKVLSTKTLDADTLAYAQIQNLEVQCMDFIETTAFPFNLEFAKNRPFDAVAFTSANAVKYFFENQGSAAFLQGKQIFSIQGKTQDELLARNIKADCTGASANDLGDAIANHKVSKNVLHVCGNLRLPVLENKLNEAGIAYTDLMVYQTGTKAKKVTEDFDAILFYSPSGVESFLTQNNLNSKTLYCCIGTTTAQALKEKANNATIVLSNEPSPKSMLTEVADYIQNHKL